MNALNIKENRKISVFLPEVASITVETPLRSETGRDDPGMLTGSERTGWILNDKLQLPPGSKSLLRRATIKSQTWNSRPIKQLLILKSANS